MQKTVIVIGGGIAGMTTASALSELDVQVILIEKENHLGGHVGQWDRLFPSLRPASEVMHFVEESMKPPIAVNCNTTVTKIIRNGKGFKLSISNGNEINGDALVITTGYDLFDARKKEEYGYGIYDNVITSAELEGWFKEGKSIINSNGKIPDRIGLIHCVGSRDEKVGNIYCSKVCCVTGVKQAIEIKQQLPEAEVFSFYMDLRMFDRNFEELYFEAQQKWGINFIRGRLSECAENPDGSLVLKTEDTLSGRPLKMTVDLLVLLVGFVPRPETSTLASMLGLPTGQDRFLTSLDEHIKNNDTTVPGVFLAGAVKGPSCIANTIADARSTAIQVMSYLNSTPGN